MTNRQPIKAAAARAGGKHVTIPVDLGEIFGGVTEYEFVPGLGVETVDLMSRFGELKGLPAQVGAMQELLDMKATEDTAKRIVADLKRGALDMLDLMHLGQALVEELSAANPTKQSSSPDGSSTTGEPSTGGLPLTGVVMPPPSAPTD